MRTIGLTGGIGSGKSTVSGILGQLGAEVVDADKIGHEIYLPNTVGWSRVVEAFGAEIVADDGTIDRKKLGAKVFSDPAELRRLNAIVHPLMAEKIHSRILEHRSHGRRVPIVIEAAVLLEAGWDRFVDEVWVVTASADQAIDRVTRDRGLKRAEVESRISNQISEEERLRGAHRVIRNDGSLDDLRSEVQRAWERITD